MTAAIAETPPAARSETRTIDGIPITRTARACSVTGLSSHIFRHFRPRGYRMGDDGEPDVSAGVVYLDDLPGQDPNTPAFSHVQTPAEEFRDLCCGEGGSGGHHVRWDLREPTFAKRRDEIGKLRECGFHDLADEREAKLDAEPKEPAKDGRLFICDSAMIRPGVHKVLQGASEDVHSLLARHQRGDHGAEGNSGDISLSPEQEWCPYRFGQDVRNAVAERTGSGIVRSRYTLAREEHVTVWTLLLPDRAPETLVTSSRDA